MDGSSLGTLREFTRAWQREDTTVGEVHGIMGDRTWKLWKP